MAKLYFPGLNALRFYAAICVVVYHTAVFIPIAPRIRLLADQLTLSGYDAVTLFFVLSGFLITYLLLVERRSTGDISIRHFYGRRALRIWPLYFLIIILTVLLVPSQLPETLGFISLLLFSGQFAAAFVNLGLLEHLWSIGVEEWFYVAWALLIKKYRLLAVIAAVILIRFGMALIISPYFVLHGDFYVNPWLVTFHLFRVECMAIGALGAWIYYYGHPSLQLIYRWQWPILIITAMIIVLPIEAGILYDIGLSLVFMGLVLNVSTNPHSVLRLDNRWLNALGKITYGIYIYHLLVGEFVARLWKGYGGGVGAYAVMILSTTAVAYISYRWIEAPLLRLKPYPQPSASPIEAPLSGRIYGD